MFDPKTSQDASARFCSDSHNTEESLLSSFFLHCCVAAHITRVTASVLAPLVAREVPYTLVRVPLFHPVLVTVRPHWIHSGSPAMGRRELQQFSISISTQPPGPSESAPALQEGGREQAPRVQQSAQPLGGHLDPRAEPTSVYRPRAGPVLELPPGENLHFGAAPLMPNCQQLWLAAVIVPVYALIGLGKDRPRTIAAMGVHQS